jgi:hypothetical protein
LIRAREGNGYLRPPEKGRDRWFMKVHLGP